MLFRLIPPYAILKSYWKADESEQKCKILHGVLWKLQWYQPSANIWIFQKEMYLCFQFLVVLDSLGTWWVLWSCWAKTCGATASTTSSPPSTSRTACTSCSPSWRCWGWTSTGSTTPSSPTPSSPTSTIPPTESASAPASTSSWQVADHWIRNSFQTFQSRCRAIPGSVSPSPLQRGAGVFT